MKAKMAKTRKFNKWFIDHLGKYHPAVFFLSKPEAYFEHSKAQQRRLNSLARRISSSVFKKDKDAAFVEFSNYWDEIGIARLFGGKTEWIWEISTGTIPMGTPITITEDRFKSVWPNMTERWTRATKSCSVGKPYTK